MRRLHFWAAIGLIAAGLALPLAANSEETGAAATTAPAEADPAAAKAKEAERYELLKLFADTLDQVERNYVEEIDRRELMEAAIRGMLSKLDPYSNYIPPEEIERFRSSVENEFGGVGITVSLETGKLAIISPVYHSPAYRAGIRGGDRILKISGQTTDGITLDEAVRQMKGQIGTTVQLTVAHATDGKEETVELTRELIRVDSVLGDRRKADDTWNFFLDPDSGVGEKKIGYLRISNFSRHTADDLRSALRELKAGSMQGLIVDLRNNPGGLLTAAVEVADLFVAEGRIVSTAGRSAPKRAWDAQEEGTFEGFPMVVLINRTSASASEIVAACLQDHGRAAIAGERSWGKGSVQNIVELEDGRSALKLTTAGYVRPSGKNIHRLSGAQATDDWGVRPDDGLEVALTGEEAEQYLADRRKRDAIVAAPKDENAQPAEARKLDKQLRAALDHLVKKIEATKSPTQPPADPASPQDKTPVETADAK